MDSREVFTILLGLSLVSTLLASILIEVFWSDCEFEDV